MLDKAIYPEKWDSVRLDISKVEGSSVLLDYHTLNDNSPADNANYIGLWESSNGCIPSLPGKKAIWSVKVDKNNESSSLRLQKLPIGDKSYVLGYCQTGVDPKTDLDAAKNVSALAVIPAIKSENNLIRQMSLEVLGDTMDAAEFRYKLLPNVDRTSHWFGIWNLSVQQVIGVDSPIYSEKVIIADKNKTGLIDLSRCSFIRDDKYILAYFACGYVTPPPSGGPSLSETKNMVSYIEFSFPSKTTEGVK